MWILYSILCAFFLALADFFTKKYSDKINHRLLAFGRIFFAVPLLWIFCMVDGIPVINKKLGLLFLAALPLDTIAIILYVKSLKISPLSVTVPFLSFTPIFLLITAPLIMKEIPTIYGVVGIFFITCGAYSLNIKTRTKGYLYPFKMIFKEKGSFYMLMVALIYSITSNFGKMGVLYSSPAFFAATYFSCLAAVLYFLLERNVKFREIFKRELLVVGGLYSLMITFHFMAVKLIDVSYMISIKRSSLLFGIIFGVFFLKEKGLKEKLLGGILMCIGITVIALLA